MTLEEELQLRHCLKAIRNYKNASRLWGIFLFAKFLYNVRVSGDDI